MKADRKNKTNLALKVTSFHGMEKNRSEDSKKEAWTQTTERKFNAASLNPCLGEQQRQLEMETLDL